jgi:hypothetical protein
VGARRVLLQLHLHPPAAAAVKIHINSSSHFPPCSGVERGDGGGESTLGSANWVRPPRRPSSCFSFISSSPGRRRRRRRRGAREKRRRVGDSILNCCRRATGASDGERAAFFLGPALDGPDNRAGPAHVDLSVPAQEPIRHRPKTSPIRGEAGAWSSFFFLLVRRGGQCNPNHPSPSPSPPVACRSVSAARRDGRYPFAACVGGMRRSSSSPYYRCA